ncbi:hypothetical protein Vretimale_11310 [Volvox reticuliferus]|uniref:RING-type domain-containing protein n=1 Tax=Volvox reticuliferus TaxID=1737510 RepID=A0A8J4FQP7_9CHLO|nr:hypothetical protein Vretifemale_12165 [Volvox reticuliferus]GIM07078.1 hypothetical protein Vretimale_11310 [Volvox reticuliferus]
MKLYRLLGFLIFISLARAARKWSPENYPNPMNDVNSCGRRGVSSWVCDPDGVLTYESANVVEGVIKKIYAGEPPYALGPCGNLGLKGYQVAVALMRHMSYVGDPGEAAGQFAKSLHNRWGVGDAHCNNGVVLLISINDRQIFVSAGSGTTSLLTYDVIGDVIDDVRPALKDQRYDEAVERAVVDIGLALAGRPVEPESGKGPWWEEWLAFGIFGTAVSGIIFLGTRTEFRKRKRYKDCKSKLEKLKRDQAAVRSNTYNPTSCPVCLEDFTDVPPGTGTPRGDTDGADGFGASGSGSGSGPAGDAVSGGGAIEKEEEEELRKPLLTPTAPTASTFKGAVLAEEYPGGAAPSAPPLPTAGETQQPSLQIQQQPQPQQQQKQQQQPVPPVQRRPLVLPCGHAFCEGCITQWLEQKKVTCPICRKPFDEDDSPPAGDPRDAPNFPRPPRPDTSNRNPNTGTQPGPSSSTGGPFSTTSSGPRPPCSVDDDNNESYVNTGYGGGVGGTVPRLRLRWGGRRRPVGMHEDLLLAEMMFRLRQLQRQHPDYISESMLHSWEQDLQNGREFSAQQLREFQLNDPATRRDLAHRGSSGSSIRFGGGSSSGGGGRGGSW